MNVSPNRRKQVNPVRMSTVFQYLVVALVLAATGLFYVHIKNQQFALGDEIRKVERRIREVRAGNEVLLARVTELSSRQALQKRIAEGFIKVQPIESNVIARLVPPTVAKQDGILRTAYNNGGSRP